MTKEEVNALVKDFLLSGMPIVKEDEDGPIMNTVIDAIKSIFDTHMPTIRAAAKEYMATEDLDALVIDLLPIHDLIWYEAYAPYWLSHCHPVSDDPDHTYFNDLIDMYWDWKHQLWSKKGEMCVTIMLPPTKGLIRHAHKESADSLAEYLDKQAAGKHD